MTGSKFDHKQIHGALQALAYWLGYERQRYRFFDLREIAIANELVHLLDPYIKQAGCYIDCEVPYRNFLPSSQNERRKADIAIWSRSDIGKSKDYEAIIELKRFKPGLRVIEKDIDRIGSVLKDSNGMTGWFVACSPGAICEEWINSSHHATRKHLRTGENTEYRIRRIVHSYPHIYKPSHPKTDYSTGNFNFGFHVVLGEVLCS